MPFPASSPQAKDLPAPFPVSSPPARDLPRPVPGFVGRGSRPRPTLFIYEEPTVPPTNVGFWLRGEPSRSSSGRDTLRTR